MNYFLPRNWSKHSRRLYGDKEGLRIYKRVILVSQFTIFGAVIGLLHAMEDLVEGLLFMPLMDATMAVFIFFCFLLNENGKHKAARICLLTFLNVFFFIYSSLAHPGLGIYLYFFAWVGLAAVVFENNENRYRFFFIGLSIVLIAVLFITDFNIFGRFEFGAVDLQRSFVINLISSMVVLVFFIVFMVNMNEQSENKLIELAAEVKGKNADLEKINHELDKFFYSASHDLKVPLMDIKGAINSAMAEFDDERVLAYFEVLKQRADKLNCFLQDIIDYARNAQTESRVERVNLQQLIDNVTDNFIFVIGADKVRFIVDCNVTADVMTDRLRLSTVLNNLVSNAIKYHRLEQPDPWISIVVEHAEGKLTFSVEDNGSGMDAELLPKIFGMFYRGTSRSKGSGLGLYIVKETIEKLGGSITVSSALGTGSRFTFSIPAEIASPNPVYTAESISFLN